MVWCEVTRQECDKAWPCPGAGSLGAGGNLSPPLHSAASSLDESPGDPFSLPAPLEVGLLANNAVAQYNLARLAGMAGHDGDDGSPGDGVVNMADLLMEATLAGAAGAAAAAATAEQNVLNNLTALAKLGSVSLNNSGRCFFLKRETYSEGSDGYGRVLFSALFGFETASFPPWFCKPCTPEWKNRPVCVGVGLPHQVWVMAWAPRSKPVVFGRRPDHGERPGGAGPDARQYGDAAAPAAAGGAPRQRPVVPPAGLPDAQRGRGLRRLHPLPPVLLERLSPIGRPRKRGWDLGRRGGPHPHPGGGQRSR